MDRKEFLTAMGMSAAALTLINCLGCAKKAGADNINPATKGPPNVNFTLDLTTAANAALLSNGGYIAANGVLIARTLEGTYIAVQQTCTDEFYPLVYEAAQHEFYCNNHGSAFTEAGVVINAPAKRNLMVYNTTLTNNSLRVYS